MIKYIRYILNLTILHNAWLTSWNKNANQWDIAFINLFKQFVAWIKFFEYLKMHSIYIGKFIRSHNYSEWKYIRYILKYNFLHKNLILLINILFKIVFIILIINISLFHEDKCKIQYSKIRFFHHSTAKCYYFLQNFLYNTNKG